jgi:murein DD-endopeptidase MepM/ murein hydrolase activator NlpD
MTLYPRIASLLALAALGVIATTSAHASTGGLSADSPVVKSLRCADGRTDACARGKKLAVRGEGLASVDEVVFMGARGHKDDVTARPAERTANRLVTAVPAAAVSGPLKVLGGVGAARSPRITLDEVQSAPATATGFVFPIRGKHKIGTTETQRFGGPRGHQGQDIFAACGKPIVAALDGSVMKADYQSAAGNYLVIDGSDGRSYVYMHMLEPAVLEVGDAVGAGDRLGAVGETGRASGCHLHFELWTAPGYYKGGEPIDPYDELREWEADS